jgi:hypothetical protein
MVWLCVDIVLHGECGGYAVANIFIIPLTINQTFSNMWEYNNNYYHRCMDILMLCDVMRCYAMLCDVM